MAKPDWGNPVIHRRYRRLGTVLALAAALASAAACATSPGQSGLGTRARMEGAWQPPAFETAITTADKTPIPFQPWAKQRYDQSVAAQAAGKPLADSSTRCLPSGVPRVMWAPYLAEIIVQPKRVLILHEVQHLMRFIYLDEPLPADPDPTYMGSSVGRWEGDTLVIETVGLTDDTILDRAGIPHTTDLKVTERLRLRPDGDTLDIRMTFDDPKTFTKPWDTVLQWNRQPPDARIREYICEENNRGVE